MTMQLLNLPHWRTLACDESDPNNYKLTVEYTAAPLSCPNCGSCEKFVKVGRLPQVYMDLPAHGRRVGLHLQRQRYRCEDCKITFVQPIPDFDDKRVMTRRLVEYIEKESLRRTFVSLAEDTGLNEKTIRNIFRDYVARLSSDTTFVTPEWLGIDEIHLMKKPRAIFTNVKQRTVIDLLENRTKATVLPRLMRFENRADIKLVTMDMWTPYRDAVNSAIPKAVVVVDKFHLQRMANISMDDIRKEIREGLTTAQRHTLMHDRYVLLKRKRDLKDKDHLVLESWTNNHPKLATAYNLKELFFDIWEAQTEADARTLYRDWLKATPAELMWTFQPIITAMTNWEREIFAYFSHHRVTNAYTESLNGLIRVTERVGRGYSFEAMRARLLYGDGIHRQRRPGYEKRPKEEGMEMLRESYVAWADSPNYGPELSTLVRELEEETPE